MFAKEKEVKGIVRNSFFQPNRHYGKGNTPLDRQQGTNTEMFRYRENKEGKIELIQMQKF